MTEVAKVDWLLRVLNYFASHVNLSCLCGLEGVFESRYGSLLVAETHKLLTLLIDFFPGPEVDDKCQEDCNPSTINTEVSTLAILLTHQTGA